MALIEPNRAPKSMRPNRPLQVCRLLVVVALFLLLSLIITVPFMINHTSSNTMPSNNTNFPIKLTTGLRLSPSGPPLTQHPKLTTLPSVTEPHSDTTLTQHSTQTDQPYVSQPIFYCGSWPQMAVFEFLALQTSIDYAKRNNISTTLPIVNNKYIRIKNTQLTFITKIRPTISVFTHLPWATYNGLIKTFEECLKTHSVDSVPLEINTSWDEMLHLVTVKDCESWPMFTMLEFLAVHEQLQHVRHINGNKRFLLDARRVLSIHSSILNLIGTFSPQIQIIADITWEEYDNIRETFHRCTW